MIYNNLYVYACYISQTVTNDRNGILSFTIIYTSIFENQAFKQRTWYRRNVLFTGNVNFARKELLLENQKWRVPCRVWGAFEDFLICKRDYE